MRGKKRNSKHAGAQCVESRGGNNCIGRREKRKKTHRNAPPKPLFVACLSRRAQHLPLIHGRACLEKEGEKKGGRKEVLQIPARRTRTKCPQGRREKGAQVSSCFRRVMARAFKFFRGLHASLGTVERKRKKKKGKGEKNGCNRPLLSTG